MSTPQIIVVDTDPGIDDAMALLFLRSQRSVKIAAITTVFGNASLEVTTRNACYLADRFAIDAPVIVGASQPLKIERPRAPSYVHGVDGLGDIERPAVVSRVPIEGAAYEHIVRLVRASPHQVTLLTLGPLTNLALALRHDPEIARLVKQVVVMGGVFGWDGRRGNVSPVAEANIYNDPHAADEVLAAPWPVTMVGLDVTMRCVFSTQAAKKLAVEAGEVGEFLWQISRGYEALYQQRDGLEGCCLHDVAAAIYVVNPGLFTAVSAPVRVVTEGIALGQTIQWHTAFFEPQGAWAGLPAQRACNEVDAPRLIRTYTDALIASNHGLDSSGKG